MVLLLNQGLEILMLQRLKKGDKLRLKLRVKMSLVLHQFLMEVCLDNLINQLQLLQVDYLGRIKRQLLREDCLDKLKLQPRHPLEDCLENLKTPLLLLQEDCLVNLMPQLQQKYLMEVYLEEPQLLNRMVVFLEQILRQHLHLAEIYLESHLIQLKHLVLSSELPQAQMAPYLAAVVAS